MPQLKTTVYSALAANRSVFAHLRGVIQDLPHAHELGYRLFKRNLKALLRQSLLGFGWALFPPLATAALWMFLRNNVMTMGDTGIPYPVFVLTGTILWQMFNEAMLAPLKQVTTNKAMLSKINIPREGLLLSGIYEMIFNILIKIGLLTIIYLYFGQSASLGSLLLVPVGIFAISLSGFALLFVFSLIVYRLAMPMIIERIGS